MTDGLEVLAPSGASVTYRGETLSILPVEIGVIPALIRAARPAIDAIFDMPELPEGGSADELTMLLDMIEKHGDEVFAAVALCAGRDEAWVRKGDPAEFFELARTVLQVNRDFFIRRLAPLLGGRAMAIAQRLQAAGIGRTPSNS